MRKWIAIFAIALAGCATTPQGPEWAGRMRNACVPEAAAMVEGLKEKGINARMLIFRADGMREGHALAVYLYPVGQNRLWAWDSTWGSLRVRAWAGDAGGISREWLRVTTGKVWNIERAEFIE